MTGVELVLAVMLGIVAVVVVYRAREGRARRAPAVERWPDVEKVLHAAFAADEIDADELADLYGRALEAGMLDYKIVAGVGQVRAWLGLLERQAARREARKAAA